ncbi:MULTISPECIES: hypothetical protein [Lentilactobacillus]|uniref:Uncharacterized protein n=3 Tax=Bacilli TaxID=91061 RepID=J9W8V7_LENBU|nr:MULTISPECIES: hypothetical protein [Lentilactobacillus]AFS00591.1 hypothetical protein LBUCD034_1567 [Lentilactobacillus buchneri subsp. silagei CD034]APR08087.1 hypothetical protein FAM21731_01937 [Lentilactobacillus parabuchneri]KRL12351.1 hypothetical protein FD05_GL001677 [Lentilactobacillus otakiensis DSM 19908 = JCM 15040]MBW0222343.1 hypothetical protein [Lentilactobacillus parabuchneri]MCT3559848.1 hypothetical protein [Lentilactobacillus buchneri]
MFIYITFDSNGFVTDYKKVETDGYTKVFVLDSWINQFAQYPDKFRYDATNQKLLNPGNLPSVSLNQVSTDVTTLQTQLQSLQSTGTQTDSQLGALVSNISVVQGQILGELQNIQTQLNASEKATTVPAANTTNSPA